MKNFSWVVPAGVAVIALALFLVLYARRYCLLIADDMYDPKISRIRELCGMSQLALFHPPADMGCTEVAPDANQLAAGGGSTATADSAGTLSGLFLHRLHGILRGKQEVSFWYEFLLVAVPYVTFGLALFKITSVFSGEMTLCETFSALGYSLVPMIVIWPVLTVLSHLVAEGEVGIFGAAQIVVYLWVAINILSAVQRINDVSLKRAVGLALLSAVGALIVWALCVLIYIFTAQLGFLQATCGQKLSAACTACKGGKTVKKYP